ncbi:molybdenum cofactor guanylyltransferase [Devosia pacifica]|uniref:molybdenum cofactor guanylyltransferase n=1 Tax=Devosia pacifica TaxID=1335967 RepID=UPI001FCE99D3|nr:NTP transferase domain-containing protein [Devosia pacifica]
MVADRNDHELSEHFPAPTFLVLAGGGGARLGGVRKADLRLKGKPLLEHVCSALPSNAGLISSGPLASAATDVPDGWISIADQSPILRGPLAGMDAAMRWLAAHQPSTRAIICCSCDAPFLPPDFTSVMIQQLAASPAAYADYKGTSYPTHAAWRVEVLKHALAQAVPGQGPRHLLAEVNAFSVSHWDHLPRNPFRNINTLADLLAAQRDCG